MSPFEQAWFFLKADFARPLPGLSQYAIGQHEPDKHEFATLYGNEEVKDVNEALRQLRVAPEGLTAEMENFAPGFYRQSSGDFSAMDKDLRQPHQYLPYKTKEERGFSIPSFRIHDREADKNTADSMNTIEELREARRRREAGE